MLAYSQKTFSAEAAPNSWADFWDVKKFPGRRALRNHPIATLEAALMADGVAPDKLYPLDVDRAFKKLEEIKPNITVWWTSGAQSAQLLNDGEVDMEMAWNGRVSAVAKEGAKVAFTYNQGILQSTSLCILKGAPNLETAVSFLNEAVDPVHQANLPLHIDYGPGNPKAFDTGVIKPERAAQLPSEPANAAKQALMSYAWWSSPAGEAAEKRWASSCRSSCRQPGEACVTHSAPSQDHHEQPRAGPLVLHQRREQRLMLALVSPALLVILLLIVLPVGWLAWQSIYHDGFTLENYRRIFTEDIYWRSFALTFEISLRSRVLALLLGYPVAYAAISVPKGWSILILSLVVLPFWTSVLVRAYAWLALLQRTGVINQLLRYLDVIDEPLALVHNTFGTVVATVHILLPFMVLPLYATMQKIPRDLMQAGASLGASPCSPSGGSSCRCRCPGVLAGCTLVFVLCLGFYITPELLGGGRTVMVSMLVSRNVELYNQFGAASAVGVVLLVSVLRDLLRRQPLHFARSHIGAEMTMSRPSHCPLRDQRAGAALSDPAGADHRADLVLQRALPDLPAAVVLAALVSAIFRQPGLDAGDAGDADGRAPHRGYRDAARRRRRLCHQPVEAAHHAADPHDAAVAAGGADHHHRGRHLLRLCQSRPGRDHAGPGAGQCHAGPALCHHLGAGGPAKLRSAQEMVARSLGMNRLRSFFAVTLPQIKSSVIAGGIFAFISAMDETIVALFISGGQYQPLTKRMFTALRDEIDPTIAAISTLMTAASFMLVLVASSRQKKGG